MADKGIIFSAPMVRALLDGRKTQTRRLLNPAPETFQVDGAECEVGLFHEPGERSRVICGRVITLQTVPYAPGDRLYVRESCRAEELEGDGRDGVRFAADGAFIGIAHTMTAAADWSKLFYYRGRGTGRIGNPVTSIHMPRWASRLWLAVTEVRVQRLQDISEADAIAEGMPDFSKIPTDNGEPFSEVQTRLRWPQRWYESLWNSLHAEHGTRWDDNPWVVAVSFDVNQGNIDAAERVTVIQ